MNAASSAAYAMLAAQPRVLPREFDWTNAKQVHSTKYPDEPPRSQYVLDPPDQGTCGSCWAVSTTDMLADRYAIALGRLPVRYSPMPLIACMNASMRCEGNVPDKGAEYYETHPTVPESNLPYQPMDGTCADVEAAVRASREFLYTRPGSVSGTAMAIAANNSQCTVTATTVHLIKYELLENGPFVTGIQVPSSLYQYRSGVFRCQGPTEGGHAVCVVGWGVTASGEEFWKIRNSWGTEWGNRGYFLLPMWSSASSSTMNLSCAVECMSWWAMPDPSRSKTTAAAITSMYAPSLGPQWVPTSAIIVALAACVIAAIELGTRH